MKSQYVVCGFCSYHLILHNVCIRNRIPCLCKHRPMSKGMWNSLTSVVPFLLGTDCTHVHCVLVDFYFMLCVQYGTICLLHPWQPSDRVKRRASGCRMGQMVWSSGFFFHRYSYSPYLHYCCHTLAFQVNLRPLIP